MQREKKIILVAHCVLNQNSVIQGWARARGSFSTIVSLLIQSGLGIIQLPCPEQRFLGLARPPMTVDEYDTAKYHQHCQSLVFDLIPSLVDYQKHGFDFVGLLGIADSPSCCAKKGIFFQHLCQQLRKQKIKLEVIQVPTDHKETRVNQGCVQKIKEIIETDCRSFEKSRRSEAKNLEY